jgi:tRNA-specific 2-thiouridylase
VSGKDLERNVLHVVQGHDHPALLSDQLQAQDVSWVAGEPPQEKPQGAHFGAKTRYRQPDAPCRYTATAHGFELSFQAAQWAVTPGQSAVLYDGEVCLGGGVISASSQEINRALT